MMKTFSPIVAFMCLFSKMPLPSQILDPWVTTVNISGVSLCSVLSIKALFTYIKIHYF